jgi:protein-S-isoprenylcysteine O-methyltransferase Ste14
MRAAFLALRSLLFLLLLPGTVAVYIPSRILRSRDLLRLPALQAWSLCAGALVVAGALVLLKCVWDFFAAGQGTLSFIDPPRRLVVRGLYRYTRNPMYSGVLAMLAGQAWLFGSGHLVEYALIVLVAEHLFVILYEEPNLASRFGESYAAYRKAVPRWGMTLRPYRSTD